MLAVALVLCRSVASHGVVFPAGGVRLLDTDAYYHLRHAGHALHDFPHLRRDDDAWAFPRGERSEGAGLFDLGIAVAARIAAGGRADDAVLIRVAAWAPVALAVATLLTLALLARRFLTRPLTLWVCAAFLMYPGRSLPVTSLGFADHHALEMVLTLAATLGLVHALGDGAGWRHAALGALPLAALQFSWIGAGLWVPILVLAALAVLTADLALDPPAHARRVRAFARYCLLALALVYAISSIPELVQAALALRLTLQALAGALALALAHAAGARILARHASPRAAAALLAAIPVAVALGLVLGSASLRAHAGYLLAPKTALVAEHLAPDARALAVLFGLPGVLAVLAVPLILWRAPADRLRLIPALCGAQIALLWLRTHDYGYQVPAFVALLAGFTLEAFPRWPLALVALIPPLLPFDAMVRPWMTARLAHALQEVDAGWEQAAAWLRTETSLDGAPDHERPPGSPAGPRWAVATTWDRGNLVAALAHRRVIWARYPMPDSARWFTETDEEASVAALCPTCPAGSRVRYVVVDAASVSRKFLSWVFLAGRDLAPYRRIAGTYGEPWLRAISVRLYHLDGDVLSRYRLVYESPDRSRHFFLVNPSTGDVLRTFVPVSGPMPDGLVHDVSEHATAKVFEVVPGALLDGVAGPNAPVEIALEVHVTTTGRTFRQVRRLRAAPDGAWRARVPYATGGAAVRAAPYRVGWFDAAGQQHTRDVTVADDDVTQGRLVHLPVPSR